MIHVVTNEIGQVNRRLAEELCGLRPEAFIRAAGGKSRVERGERWRSPHSGAAVRHARCLRSRGLPHKTLVTGWTPLSTLVHPCLKGVRETNQLARHFDISIRRLLYPFSLFGCLSYKFGRGSRMFRFSIILLG